MENLTVAAVCMRSVPGSVEDNFDRLKRMTLEASSGGADVVCFPECALSGYDLNAVDQAHGYWDLKTAAQRLMPVAEKARVVIIAGLIETVNSEKPYITQIVVGPGGLFGCYRKTHLSPPEDGVYQPGRGVELFHVDGIVFGVQLCYEAHFPELSARMALMGADVIFMPHASPRGTPEEKRQSWMRHLPARAFDNGLFVVACNLVGMSRSGLSFPGVALILGPDGRQVAAYAGDEETILYATLDADLLKRVRGHRMRYFLPRRRPELYM